MAQDVTAMAAAKLRGIAGSILESKGGSAVHSIGPNETVYTAVAKLKEHHIGALLVMEGEVLVGIISERDYTRKIILEGRASNATLVKEIMTTPVIAVTPSDSLSHCMRVMSERRIRHLPVVDSGRISGVISIGDLMRAIILQQEETIGQLNTLITDPYPA